MRQEGVITAVAGTKVTIRIDAGGECSACPSRESCHGFSGGVRHIEAINDIGAAVDDRVIVEAGGGKTILTAFLVFMLPLLMMLAGYALAVILPLPGNPIAYSLLFLAGSFFLLRWLDRRIGRSGSFHPRVTGKAADRPDHRTHCPELSPPGGGRQST